jgi:hypothetical protein
MALTNPRFSLAKPWLSIRDKVMHSRVRFWWKGRSQNERIQKGTEELKLTGMKSNVTRQKKRKSKRMRSPPTSVADVGPFRAGLPCEAFHKFPMTASSTQCRCPTSIPFLFFPSHLLLHLEHENVTPSSTFIPISISLAERKEKRGGNVAL